MSTDFEPANDLERTLVAAQQGRLPVASFMDKLIASQVLVLFDREPVADGKRDESAIPMILTNQAGQPVLAVFTAPERASDWSRREPRFQTGLLTDFAWLLRGISPQLGVVVNPGLKEGLEMPASGVAQLKARAQRQ